MQQFHINSYSNWKVCSMVQVPTEAEQCIVRKSVCIQLLSSFPQRMFDVSTNNRAGTTQYVFVHVYTEEEKKKRKKALYSDSKYSLYKNCYEGHKY